MIHRMDPPADPTREEMPDFVAPMLAKLSTLPADESQWAFEVKWDGVRAIAHSEPGPHPPPQPQRQRHHRRLSRSCGR